MQGRWLVTILTPQFPATRTKESTPQASVLHLRGANPLFVPPVRSHDLLHQVKETDKSTWANCFEMTSDIAPEAQEVSGAHLAIWRLLSQLRRRGERLNDRLVNVREGETGSWNTEGKIE
ncbi:hypothetical protein HBI56_008700 [Parastagonospora nodorum]|uniref:Uncharacterized protein n=1 Tax=Phaeosphaeria nodorum (strain SN15 / ATCC MYA-4574 / FGSC 10173) TaxID=321614 RepID=A0A7U2ETR0_PHANO|nr:hypothetical protein HBH56_236150 [Parastagonospora nodorum]QRC90950.1 hypothetical protein JI435_400780 [Parastagonospora nodorum SN15]KAH3935242.1 hypothetical protein HBH54_046570 [Parastagonospora nodorum]KAH3950152.1 hypothetical protein HBH53_077390 [Parastagonospora nodorum]KAH3986730.1 hypothetical protein HBH51_010450 [Parastagonospora nodorum]